MGRAEPCILFAQSFVHSQLDEYADEVTFVEPVVITACEFLEQNASPSSSNISLIGATSPPSFALEVFVHCEGESRFRRLCQPFLYSHSSSNVLEVEAVVTNHLLVRGKYRSLTMVIYGNTAEDLGQFNVEFETDSSLANVVYSSSDGNLEDLPPALRSTKLTFEEYISSFGSLGFPFPDLDITPDMKQFLQLAFMISKVSNEQSTICKLVTTVVSAVSSYVKSDNSSVPVYWDHHMLSGSIDDKKDPQQVIHVISEARKELFEIYKNLRHSVGSSLLLEDEIVLGPEAEVPTSEVLVEMFSQTFPSLIKTADAELSLLPQNKDQIIGLGLALLLCSSQESCYWFVSYGSMEKIINIFSHEVKKSTSTTLFLLGIVEFATRHAVGCEGFLGWWPREDDNVPIRRSDGYSYLLELLLGNQRHDVASLATYILHRLRLYEIASRYESAVLSGFTNLASDSHNITDGAEFLPAVNELLKHILSLLTSFGPIEDPSSMSSARKLLIPGQSEDLLSYRTTFDIFATSKFNFVKSDTDPYLLSLLKEKGFFPLSTALLSSPGLRSASGSTMDTFVDIVISIQSILLSLLSCRSGLSFLLDQPEATTLIILSLKDVEDMGKAECMTLRQASNFLLKGFFCRPQDVGIISELHLRVGIAVGRLLTPPCNSDELLWVLWDLCAISRSNCGREAVLTLRHFPEAINALLNALCSFKDVEAVAVNSAGTSPLSLAIFHSAAEIFEVMVTDPTASSLRCWIGHAVELHKALHSSSPGSNRKDAPTRLLEWIDAGVIYHRNGATGVLRYAAVLASGGDAHLSSTNVLVSDSIDIENIVGDSTSAADTQVVDNLLGKLASEKNFDGIALRNTSIVQLTTSIRILAVLSENSAVAASLFEEGAMTVIFVVLVNCKYMLERLSTSYDFLVDEGAECNSTSDLLLERCHEQSLLDLMIPSLVMLINLLRNLQNAKELYRNKKLLNALLKLHREVSPKLAACAADLSFPYPTSALGFGAVCHLLASALACWPVFGWTPSLFHCVLESVQPNALLPLGPKDACSMLCLLGDLFPEEGIFLWKKEMPPLTALRTLSIGTILGTQMESDINWYLQPEHLSLLLIRLTPHLERIAKIVLHFAFTSLVVVQDMLRIFIIRIASQKIECAVVLLRPIISWMDSLVIETSPSDSFIFKMHRLLHFIASLLEHPQTKTLLLKVGALRILQNVLQRCSDASLADKKQGTESRLPSKSVTILSWSYPVFKCLTSIFSSELSTDVSEVIDKCSDEYISNKDCTSFGSHLLKLCQVLPVGRELVACVISFKELISSSQGRSAILSFLSQIRTSALEEQESVERDTDANNLNDCDWRRSPPFLSCLKKLLISFDSKDSGSTFVIETIYALSLSAMRLSLEGKDPEGVVMFKFLFGLQDDHDGDMVSSDEKLKDVCDLIQKVEQKIVEEEIFASSSRKSTLHQVKDSLKSVLFLLRSRADLDDKLEGIHLSECCQSLSSIARSVIITSQLMSPRTVVSVDDAVMPFFANVWKSTQEAEESSNEYNSGVFAEKFVWECPDSSPDRQPMSALLGKRKLTSADGAAKRMRDNSGSEATGSNTFYRAVSMPSVSSAPSRRDTFRQRKPNTSRPPSMHVDDYVARERNIDGVSSGSNIINHRGGSSGRPPSIHVDEFMARQRERQNTPSVTVGDPSNARNSDHENVNDPVKLGGSQQLKADLDDDLQEINIVFDEESESDDRMPFPQPDDNLQSAHAVTGEISPGSVVEENDNTNASTRIQSSAAAAYEDEASRSDFSLKQSTTLLDIPMTQELKPSIEKKIQSSGSMDKTLFHEQSGESKYSSPVVGSRGSDAVPLANPRNYPSHSFNMFPASSVEPVPPPRLYHRNSPQKTDGSLRSNRYHEQKFPINQPPLPPTPPPTLSSLPGKSDEQTQNQSSTYTHSMRDVQPPLPSGYPVQSFDVNGSNTIAGLHIQADHSASSNQSVPMATSQIGMDSRYAWNTTSSGNRPQVETFTSNPSARPMPPLPPHPPPFSTQKMQSSATSSGSHASLFNQTTNVGVQPPPPSTSISDTSLGFFPTSGNNVNSYAVSPFATSLLISRPVSGTFFSSPSQHPGLPVSGSWPSIQSMQPRPPPPPPPQVPHPHQHIGTSGQASQPQSEQGIPLQQNTVQFQVQPLQVPQQLHNPQLQFYYQTQQQEPLIQPTQTLVEQLQPQNLHQVADNTHQQMESGLVLQQYFSSPEAILSLLNDREKLCQLLEQHPKLMQMLQDKL